MAAQTNFIEETGAGLPLPSKKDQWHDIARLAWPPAVELMLGSLIGMITMALVASIGSEAVSAVGITGQPMMIPWVAIQAFSVGGMAVVARCIGMGDKAGTRLASEQTMLLSIIFSLVAGAVLYLWGGPIIRMMGATPDYYSMAELYMRYSAVAVVFQSISSAVASMLRSAGKTKLSMYFNVVANVANVILGLILINGLGPVPRLGLLGAAIAQLAARIIGCAMALYILFAHKELSICPTIKGILTPNLEMIKRIFKVGSSSALEQLALRVGLIAFTIYVIHLGTAEFAAHNIAGTMHGYVVNFGSAIGMALVPLVGQNLGAKRPDIAGAYINTAIKMCFSVSFILIIPFLTIPQYLALIFIREPEVVENIVIAIRILAFFTTAQIFQIAVCGALRGGGDTKWPLISTMVGVLGMRMILGYIFIVIMQMGIAGAWLSWLLDQTARAVIIYFRYRGGKWKMVRV